MKNLATIFHILLTLAAVLVLIIVFVATLDFLMFSVVKYNDTMRQRESCYADKEVYHRIIELENKRASNCPIWVSSPFDN